MKIFKKAAFSLKKMYESMPLYFFVWYSTINPGAEGADTVIEMLSYNKTSLTVNSRLVTYVQL